jgi:hypothetical protein
MAAPKPVALHHTCFLVRDLEGTAQRLSDSLEIDLWNKPLCMSMARRNRRRGPFCSSHRPRGAR